MKNQRFIGKEDICISVYQMNWTLYMIHDPDIEDRYEYNNDT